MASVFGVAVLGGFSNRIYVSGVGTRESCRNLFTRLKFLTLTGIFILETACLILQKFRENVCRTPLRATRATSTVSLPIPRTTQDNTSIICGGKGVFNKLPKELRVTASERLFKSKVKSLLLSRPYYSLGEFFRDVF